MPRVRLRWMLIRVACVGLVLGAIVGLKRRADRCYRDGLSDSSRASRLESLLSRDVVEDGQVESLLGVVHWNDAVADAFYLMAKTPWLPGDPDPSAIVCKCGGCLSGKGILAFGLAYGRPTLPESARNPP